MFLRSTKTDDENFESVCHLFILFSHFVNME